MDSDSSAKFSFAFFLAILFHLLLIFLVILGLSFPPEITTKKVLQAMQATILEIQPATENDAELPKKLSRAEKKRLAVVKKQALRLAQAEKQKLLAAAAQQLVMDTLQGQKREQEIARFVVKIKSLWKRPAGSAGQSCIIRIELSASGQIKKVVVSKSSGNKLFDDSAKDAAYKAESFQLPEDEMVRQKMLAGISVHFGDE